MSYLHGVSVRKGGLGAFPAVPAFLVVMAIRWAFGVELTAEQAIALSAFFGGVVSYFVNRFKHSRKRRA